MDAMDVLNGCTLKRPTMSGAGALAAGNLSVSALDRSSFTKKLKRMPHLFTRVLELPLHAETPVRVVESRDCYLFQVRLPCVHVQDLKVEVLEIVPGATKVLVRGVGNYSPDADVAEVSFWRFRLPPTTVPEKSVAIYEREFLSVTIPKVPVSCIESQEKNDEEDSTIFADDPKNSSADHSDVEFEGETEEERMQREVLEDLESFGSPRRVRSSPVRSRSTPSSPSPVPSPKPRPSKSFDSEVDLEKLQHEVLEDLESFGSPRRRSASCAQSLNFERTGSQDFFRSVGSWVGGFAVPVQ